MEYASALSECRVATVLLRRNARTFQGLSTTFSRPIPAIYYMTVDNVYVII